VGLCALAAASVAAVPGQAAAAPDAQRVLELVGGSLLTGPSPVRAETLNLCGANPACASRGGGANVAFALNRIDAAAQPPDVLAFQEVCGTQARALMEGLGARGYRAAFVVTKTDADGTFACLPYGSQGGHRTFGNVVALRGEGGFSTHAAYLPRTTSENVQVTSPDDLPTPATSEQRKLVCVTGASALGRPLRACSTHLIASSDVALRARQITTLAEHVDGLAADGTPTVLAGDLNTTPSLLPGILPATGAADVVATDTLFDRFHDAAALILPIPTSGARRIDYVLASRRGFGGGRALVFDPGEVSDHLGVSAELALR
jgi:endonuclease/exonuclease/phosphatase family metal-dependent hydrolase